jgi:hypothetical protein
VVAGIHVAVELQGERGAAGGRVHAEPGGLAVPAGQGDVEQLHVHLADVAPHPLLEHADEKGSPLVGGHGTVGDHVAERHAVLGVPLHEGDELDELRAALVAQKAVDLRGVRGVGGVHGREGVPLHAVLLESCEAAHHLVERSEERRVGKECTG